jgi:hypothetical protein
MMTDYSITLENLQKYRRKIYRSSIDDRIHTLEDAIRFINQRGLIAFWPLNGIPLPSLWAAAAGDRPVPDEHDDPGHITWGWKDELLSQKKCFYARILCKRNFFASLDLLPNLYALTRNTGDLTEDHKVLYDSGELSHAAFVVYETLLNSGPMDTITIKRVARLTGKEGDRQFNQAIDTLQNDIKILPVGISRSGGWHYAFIYDIVPRHFPDLIDRTRLISELIARKTLILNYLNSVGAASENEIRRLFKWESKLTRSILDGLITSKQIKQSLIVEKDLKISCYAIADLI